MGRQLRQGNPGSGKKPLKLKQCNLAFLISSKNFILCVISCESSSPALESCVVQELCQGHTAGLFVIVDYKSEREIKTLASRLNNNSLPFETRLCLWHISTSAFAKVERKNS